MKISYNWLKQYVNLEMDPQQLSSMLTDCGLEVEGLEMVESVKGGLAGVLIGEVVGCERHPNADRLTVTTVDVGKDDLLHVVCGAPNVKAGQKVPVATVGTRLYTDQGEFEIKKSKIRGELSEGMICAEDELGLGDSHEGIMVLDNDAIPGTAAKEYFNIKTDWVYEIGLTPNRTDAMSHLGVARDIMAVINNMPGHDFEKVQLNIPAVDRVSMDYKGRSVKVTVEDIEACPRYSGITMEKVEVGESPAWLKNYLNAIGVRPINNIVDISNYVLFETGQPLHIFDADHIADDHVIVKKMDKGSRFITLDEVERELTGHDLMICDTHEGMCIGGVFGGIQSGVTESTKTIFIESANFDAKTIRKTSRHHGLQTDASFRFERGVDPNGTLYALKRAVLLIKDLCNGKISSEIVDVYPEPVSGWPVDIDYTHVERLIGEKLPVSAMQDILTDLGCEIESADEHGMRVIVPTFKVDVTREADVIEEILRIWGYNNIDIPDAVRSSLAFSEKPDKIRIRQIISDWLSDNGFHEIMNNSLTNSAYSGLSKDFPGDENVVIMNPVSQDLDVLRRNLLYGSLESVRYNVNRKKSDLRFYEIGTIYKLNTDIAPDKPVTERFTEEPHLAITLTGRKEMESWNTGDETAGFFELKSIVHSLLSRVGVNVMKLGTGQADSDVFEYGLVYSVGSDTLLQLGKVNAKLAGKFDIKQELFYADINWDRLIGLIGSSKVDYKDLSKFPEVRRDLALLLSRDIPFSEISRIAFRTERHILRKVNLFDVFEDEKIGRDKKSYAVSFILQDQKKTLTDKEIDRVMNKLIRAYQQELGAVIR